MPLHKFIAANPAEAIAHIRRTLGAEAVVVDVRKVPNKGWTALWQKPQIEVLAQAPDPKALAPLPEQFFSELREEFQRRKPNAEANAHDDRPPVAQVAPAPTGVGHEQGWQVREILEQSGLLPEFSQQVFENVQQHHPWGGSHSIAEQVALAREELRRFWVAPPANRSDVHVFVGPPGTGKTTCLLKWLTQAVLVEQREAVVYRLDSHVANTAEALSVMCEVLGVRLERFPATDGWARDGRMVFIDLPGVSASDPHSLTLLRQQLTRIQPAEVHLVLNLAYGTPLLLQQARGFADFPVTDLIPTHLDEEPQWGRVWNLIMATRRGVRFLSGGQNIPGQFLPATPDRLFAHQLEAKHEDSCRLG